MNNKKTAKKTAAKNSISAIDTNQMTSNSAIIAKEKPLVSNTSANKKVKISDAESTQKTQENGNGLLLKNETVLPKKTSTANKTPKTIIKDITTTNSKEVEKASKPSTVKKTTVKKKITKTELIQNSDTAALEPKQEKKVIQKKAASTEQKSLVQLEKIIFQVKYSTKPGQTIYVTGNHSLLGNNDLTNGLQLNYLNHEYWFGTLEIPKGDSILQPLQYHYFITNEDDTITEEWGNDKIINPSKIAYSQVHIYDNWNDASLLENTFYTEPFQDVLFAANKTEVPGTKGTSTHLFKVKSPLLKKGQVLCIVGSDKALGMWDTQNPILLSHSGDDAWHTCAVNLSSSDFPVAYKYGLYDFENKQFIAYEENNNRVIYESASKDTYTIINEGFVNIQSVSFKGAGVAIPVFSLRSQQSFGVGEFSDIKLLADWAHHIGLKLIQILPVNDTTATHTFTDSYPYAAISAFALHPIYLHLQAVIPDSNKKLLNALKAKQEELNKLPEVDYEAVMATKWSLIQQAFTAQKTETFASKDFDNFFTENEHWLVPYAVFCYLREKNKTADFSKWSIHSTYNSDEIKAIAKTPETANENISIYYFVQYHLHLQLKDATAYAHKKGIIVKGDIPIGIYRHSADAWQDPTLYNMDKQAGAPPDDFAVKGQNWGFPTYNWKKMKEDGYEWWKKRFKQMSYYFDAFRIDHILGFFRIWSIPLHAVQGILGHFVPAVPLHIHELHSRGIHFDYDRFCKPYITDGILTQMFGEDAEKVREQFFEWHSDNRYQCKSEFDTQRKIEEYFAGIEKNETNNILKEKLQDLIANIILIEHENSGGQQYHCRIGMENTISFQHLDAHSKHQLKELYLDYFYKRQDDFWRKEALQKLPELKRSTNMLVCGEDLGMVPASVPGVMHDLAILSLEIQRMPKDPTREFFHPNDAPYLSVVTPSTHDMSTIRGWWEEDRTATQHFFNNELGQWGTAPYFCEPWICRIILMQHFYSPAMWSIFQLQDLMSVSNSLRRENPQDERINIPANPKHYWRYRMHISLETLQNETEFNHEIGNMVKNSGR